MFFVAELNVIDFTRYGFVGTKTSLLVSLRDLKSGLKTARIGWDSDVAVYSILSFRLPKPQSHVPLAVLVVFPLITRIKPKAARASDDNIIATTGMERFAKI